MKVTSMTKHCNMWSDSGSLLWQVWSEGGHLGGWRYCLHSALWISAVCQVCTLCCVVLTKAWELCYCSCNRIASASRRALNRALSIGYAVRSKILDSSTTAWKEITHKGRLMPSAKYKRPTKILTDEFFMDTQK